MSRTAKRNLLVFLALVVVVSVLVLNTRRATESGRASHHGSVQPQATEEEIPHTALTTALNYVASLYEGDIKKIVLDKTKKATGAEWRQLEDGNTSAISVEDMPSTEPVYAVVFKADLSRPNPADPNKPFVYKAGRVVFDKTGLVLNHQLWVKFKEAKDAMGEIYDG
jgi:hypothetical protein